MFIKNNKWFLLLTAMLFLSGKIWYSAATATSLAWILKPVDFFVSTFVGYTSIYHNGVFYYPQLDILIDKSCSGFNFGLIAFLSLTIALLHSKLSKFTKWKLYPLLLLIAYCSIITVSGLRIIIAIFIFRHTRDMISTSSHAMIHQLAGTCIHLGMLVIIYNVFSHVFKKFIINEIV